MYVFISTPVPPQQLTAGGDAPPPENKLRNLRPEPQVPEILMPPDILSRPEASLNAPTLLETHA